MKKKAESKPLSRIKGATSPDSLCSRSANRNIRLSIRKHPDGFIQVEADKKSLRFLGNLLIAQADFPHDCAFQIHPNGPGSAFFEKSSELGIIIHRLPCMEEKQIAAFKARQAKDQKKKLGENRR